MLGATVSKKRRKTYIDRVKDSLDEAQFGPTEIQPTYSKWLWAIPIASFLMSGTALVLVLIRLAS